MFSAVQAGRKWLLAFTALLALALWAGALVASWPRQDGVVAVRPDLAGQVGVNLEADELAGAALEPALSRLDGSGIRWVRFTVPWDFVEPERGRFEWGAADRIFEALARHPSLNLLVVLDRSPEWARDVADAGNPLAPSHQRADFGAFAAAVARRYGGQVRYYQIWHEPNIAPHWGARPADPAGYLGLLREAAVQIRASDHDSDIVLAALAPTVESAGANMNEAAFLDAIYGQGGRAWFDIVAAEPFGFSDPPEAAPASAAAEDAGADPRRLNFGRVALLRQVMVRHGDAGTPIWAAAFGWNALPAGWAGSPSIWGQVSEAAQAQYAAAATDLAATRWPWLGPLFWAADCPPRAPDDPWRGFGLCATDGSSRQVWTALVTAANRPPILPPGDHAPDHPALQYSSAWRVTPQAADPSADGDLLSFSFYGTELRLRVQGGPYWALYRLAIDGQPANSLPRDEAGAAYLVLYDPLAEVRVVTVAQHLPPGVHQARVEATGGWGQWALQGVLVADSGRPGLPLSATLALCAALVTLVGAVLAWNRRRSPGERQMADGEWRVQAAAAGACRILDRAAGCAGPSPQRRLAAGALLWGAAVLLSLLVAFSERTVVDLAALAGLGLIFLIRPDIALPLIAAAIPLTPRGKLLLGRDTSLYEILIWGGLLAAAARYALQWLAAKRETDGGRRPAAEPPLPAGRGALPPQVRRRSDGSLPVGGRRPAVTSLDLAMLAVLLSGLISTLAAGRQDVAWTEFRRVFLDGALFYGLITRVPASAGGQRTPGPGGRRFSPWPLVHGLLLGMTLVSGLALWQLVTGQGRVDVEGVWRARALYGSPNNLALVLGRAVPLALAVTAFGWGNRPARLSPAAAGAVSCPRPLPAGRGRAETLRRGVYGAVAVLTGLACVATFSRGALLLGLPAGVGLVLIGGSLRSRGSLRSGGGGRRPRWPVGLLLVLVLLAVLLFLALGHTPRFSELLDLRSGTGFFRLKLWQAAWRMGADHPWLGVGPDNFLYAYRTRYVLPLAWQELNLSHPHNILLDVWTRLGLLGVLACGWALCAAGRAGLRAILPTAMPAMGRMDVACAEAWPLALGLLGGLAATVAHGLVDNSLFTIDLMGLFALAAGLLDRLGLPSDPQGEG